MKINITEYFDEIVQKQPNDVAVIDGENKYTFAEIDEKSIGLASALISKIETMDDEQFAKQPIAVFLPKSVDVIVSNIAILKAGRPYMNLDIGSPISRIEAILKQVKPAQIITNSKHSINLSTVFPASRIICFGAMNFEFAPDAKSTLNLLLGGLIDTDPKCIINTSGSTGVPKSVVLNHKSFIDFYEWASATEGLVEKEVMGCLSPVVFDIYSFELCMMMCGGCAMVLIPDSLGAFPARILDILQLNAVTYIFWVPTVMTNIADMGLLEQIPLPNLKMVWFAGEVFPTKQFNVWRKNMPSATFVNLYGPIEITLDCTFYKVNRELADDEPIPIGRACRNTDILILTDKNALAKVGEEGELCVRGTSLAMGYYNDSEKTAAAFTQNPLNPHYPELIYRTGDIASINEMGEILFRGRRDTLIKHSGYRIELSEIEHVIINALKLVSNGCAVYDFDKKKIVFFYTNDKELSIADFRKAILSSLPKYMVPAAYIKLDEMPMNANGKIDRLKLQERAKR